MTKPDPAVAFDQCSDCSCSSADIHRAGGCPRGNETQPDLDQLRELEDSAVGEILLILLWPVLAIGVGMAVFFVGRAYGWWPRLLAWVLGLPT